MMPAQIIHKEPSSRWSRWFHAFMAAQAMARPEAGLLPWIDRRPASPLAMPDDAYNLIRSAFRPRL